MNFWRQVVNPYTQPKTNDYPSLKHSRTRRLLSTYMDLLDLTKWKWARTIVLSSEGKVNLWSCLEYVKLNAMRILDLYQTPWMNQCSDLFGDVLMFKIIVHHWMLKHLSFKQQPWQEICNVPQRTYPLARKPFCLKKAQRGYDEGWRSHFLASGCNFA